MRVAVTGAAGRLGRAVVAALEDAPFTGPWGPIAWPRADFDLDAPESVGGLLARDRLEAVVHCAAWTDVDGCAREPELAMRRNGEATGVLARACARAGIDLVVVSTNEVFDGLRTDGRGYRPDDPTSPPNAYGASKLAGEAAARDAFETGPGGAQLAIVRTAWLYGPPGDDFPDRILSAAERARASGEPLRLVADEWGSPTCTADVADAIAELLGSGELAGTHHVVNAGVATRAEWAREVLRMADVAVETRDVSRSEWPRASNPPAWGVLEPTPLPGGEPLREWRLALADEMPTRVRSRARSRGRG
ncbi:MAG TPA: NAD(P)-dependent oxidoreductase [Candidatus Limnocylindrales bacterium]